MVATVHSGYSTGEVAKALNVTNQTIYRWLRAGELPEPSNVEVGGVAYRIWSEEDLKRAKEYREAHYRQKRRK